MFVKSPLRFVFLLLLFLTPAVLPAEGPPGKPGEMKKEEEKKPPIMPEEKSSPTKHSITLDGKKIDYTATAGNYLMKDEDGTPKASIFYVAYTRDGLKDPSDRPVTFSFNGGPGAAAVWVQFGAFGPRVVEQNDEGWQLPPPGRLVDNESSILDVTDLVFIDPVSTGYSRPVPGVDAKQFHGIKPDIESVGEFIRLWITRNERWASPKFLAGESYGTTRSAGLSEYLQSRFGMDLSGVVLISSVLDWQSILFGPGNDRPYIVYLPTYAASAWYHKKLAPELSGDLEKTLREVENFATHEYAEALLEGDSLPAARRQEIAVKVARYTGLSVDYVLRANLRIEIEHFCKELMRGEGKIIGRLDSRFTGWDIDSVGENPEYDPAGTLTDGPYVAMLNDYLRRELGYKDDHVYERLAQVWPWTTVGFEFRYPYLSENLREAMVKNPNLQVLVASGHYDLATPYFDAVITANHLGLPAELRSHMKLTTYDAGHMMYIRRPDHQKLKKEIAEFIRMTTALRKK
ncbi:MAG TPA: peptidase S10 [Thermoanaerobaculia bacterium]|jgi:carboxypeptidase C (cathepsin A)|nr:peptidase S10 [Thermoanaerobaculia bacterium]